MILKFQTTFLALLVGTLLGGSVSAATVQNYWEQEEKPVAMPVSVSTDTLPDIGITAGSTLSIGQEIQMGNFYVRQMRAATPLIDDPLLVGYINQLGEKLVSHAYSVKTPFHFYLVNNNELNAFAFFGGNVVIHSGIFRYSDNEDQLASVMAHEISHVTQRHLARAMEDQKNNAPFTWVGALGSIILATASPQAGMAALTTTLAGGQQSMISFTQANEQEADRIGIQVLERAGFDPQSMPDFLQKLADESRGSTAPPEMLLTHPLPDSRLADIRNRAGQMARPQQRPISKDFLLAKVRVMTMYAGNDTEDARALIQQLQVGGSHEKIAAQYGEAILAYQDKQYDKASALLLVLNSQAPDNAWFLDALTDVDIARQQAGQAVARLEKSGAVINNPVLQLNLANACLEAGQYAKAHKILNKYTFTWPDDPNGWSLLEKASAAEGERDQELAARAEGLALKGKLDDAVTLLKQASASGKGSKLDQARYDARIDQLRGLAKIFEIYTKN
ncbi:tetratricopeptide repeat protein [Rahnella ecdela]|uniref:Beta-barrel assembly-enhancing protease n=1 Tax=Rahnella ecdela TaxID=2816250 RepID=A0ABS6LDM4_9GAMM|nr:M48 family metallopeptidase [Rahnella ecdela]MBU9845032.1 M48 family metallopeptidase [Rahnella ecdela]